ncbi:hypothetical protein PUN28_016071 [Cardiocondyla obscurior]|uniref:Uncharacterized protein n=1 Tax=Cardiocondyla obscurior TaxID=286306 RepID=A0AAW2ET73_9HYME
MRTRLVARCEQIKRLTFLLFNRPVISKKKIICFQRQNKKKNITRYEQYFAEAITLQIEIMLQVSPLRSEQEVCTLGNESTLKGIKKENTRRDIIISAIAAENKNVGQCPAHKESAMTHPTGHLISLMQGLRRCTQLRVHIRASASFYSCVATTT